MIWTEPRYTGCCIERVALLSACVLGIACGDEGAGAMSAVSAMTGSDVGTRSESDSEAVAGAKMNGQPCAFDPMLWPSDEPGTVTVPIRAGWWSRLLEVRCD